MYVCVCVCVCVCMCVIFQKYKCFCFENHEVRETYNVKNESAYVSITILSHIF